MSGRLIDGALVDYLDVVDRPMAVVGRDRILWANTALAKLVSRAVSDLSEQPLAELTDSEVVSTSLRIQVSPCDLKHATGLPVRSEVRAVPISAATWMLEFSLRNDIDSNEELQIYKERLWTLADQVPVGIFFSEVGMRLQYVNDRLAEIFDAPVERLVGMGWLDHIADRYRREVEDCVLSVLKGSRDEITVEIRAGIGVVKRVNMHFASVQSSDGSAGFVGTVEDVTDRVAHEERLTFAATHDPLTGLPNRAALDTDLLMYLDHVRARDLHGLMIVFCDLDDFKAINDNLGHLAGDRLLNETANRLRHACRDAHRVYRYAGDEFVILCPGVADTHEAVTISREFEESLVPSIQLSTAEIRLSASVGYALSLSGEVGADQLLVAADQAMYAVKAFKKQSRSTDDLDRPAFPETGTL
ncbi:MAG: diguanylate cyclase domain-containing protein [Acidimicrobiales bacterium]